MRRGFAAHSRPAGDSRLRSHRGAGNRCDRRGCSDPFRRSDIFRGGEAMSTLPEVCTFDVAGQLFGINAVDVQEVMRAQRITRVPLAPAGVAGLLNVRGELVTAIDLRSR